MHQCFSFSTSRKTPTLNISSLFSSVIKRLACVVAIASLAGKPGKYPLGFHIYYLGRGEEEREREEGPCLFWDVCPKTQNNNNKKTPVTITSCGFQCPASVTDTIPACNLCHVSFISELNQGLVVRLWRIMYTGFLPFVIYIYFPVGRVPVFFCYLGECLYTGDPGLLADSVRVKKKKNTLRLWDVRIKLM